MSDDNFLSIEHRRKEKRVFYIGVSNSYGGVKAVDNADGTYHLELDDYTSTCVKEISKRLFDLIVSELEEK